MPLLFTNNRKIKYIYAVILLLGIVVFVARGTIKDWLDFGFSSIVKDATLPEEKTVDQVLSNENDNINDKSINAELALVNNKNANTDNETNVNSDENSEVVLGTQTQKKNLPKEINLKVPFTSQAPYANWKLPYGEACEEASALMVHYFYQKKSLDKNRADKEILNIVDFQNKKYGFYKDSNASETARFIKDLWKYKNVRVLSATIENIKQELANGKPVLVPAAGRLLGNPNFRAPGPLYHMLVIKGYTKDNKFITNDPGTRKGSNYVYDQKKLLNAIHDWNNGDVNNGKKVIIVVDPK